MQTVHDGRIYTLKIYCGEKYPDEVCGAALRSWAAAVPRLRVLPSGAHQLLRAGPSAATSRRPSPPSCTQAPQVRFQSRVQMSCVAPNGAVDPRSFALLGRWTRAYTMETLLTELRREMAAPHNRKLPQPPEGSTY